VFNSWGLLEIAINKGNFMQSVGAKVGDKVTVGIQD
jgi:S-adenosylmethionine hydrolase